MDRGRLGGCPHSDPADDQVVEGRDRIRLRPQPDPTGLEARVAMVELERAVEPRLHVIARRHDPEAVPLAERRRLDAGAGELPPSPIIGVQAEVVLECIGADDVVAAIREPKDDAAGGILAARDRLELHRHVDVGVGPGRRHDHVERISRRALHEHLLAAWRSRHLFNCPLAIDGVHPFTPVVSKSKVSMTAPPGNSSGVARARRNGRRSRETEPGDRRHRRPEQRSS